MDAATLNAVLGAIGGLGLGTILLALVNALGVRRLARQGADLKEESTAHAALLRNQAEDRQIMRETVYHLRSEVTTSETQSAFALAQYNKAIDANTALQLGLAKVQYQLDTAQEHIAVLDTKVASQADTNASLTKQVAELTASNNALQAKVTELSRNLAEAQATIKALSDANQALKEKK